MLSTNPLLLPLFGSVASAANLWATHYSGTINYLTFNGSSLTLTSSSRTNNNLPSWITYDSVGKALYIPDEVFQGPSTGSLVSFSTGENGALTSTGKGTTPQGVVATTLYGGPDGRSFIANVHYQTSQLTTFKLPLTGGQPLQTMKYTMATKGPNPRQDVPHPHHVILDPTQNFLIIPDLGADLLRIHTIDKTTGTLTECSTTKAIPGSGPRHATFYTPSPATTILYTANELSNTISTWSLSGPPSCPTLSLRQTLTPYANNATAPRGTKLGEIKHKGQSLYTSNRNDNMFSGNDSMTHFSIAADGLLTWMAVSSSYGTYPRTFDVSENGDFVAIGDQTTANVVVVQRDVETGRLGARIADLRIGAAGRPESEDGLSAVVWAE